MLCVVIKTINSLAVRTNTLTDGRTNGRKDGRTSINVTLAHMYVLPNVLNACPSTHSSVPLHSVFLQLRSLVVSFGWSVYLYVNCWWCVLLLAAYETICWMAGWLA